MWFILIICKTTWERVILNLNPKIANICVYIAWYWRYRCFNMYKWPYDLENVFTIKFKIPKLKPLYSFISVLNDNLVHIFAWFGSYRCFNMRIWSYDLENALRSNPRSPHQNPYTTLNQFPMVTLYKFARFGS